MGRLAEGRACPEKGDTSSQITKHFAPYSQPAIPLGASGNLSLSCFFSSNCLKGADRSSIQLTPYFSHFHWEQTQGTRLPTGFLLFLPYVLLFKLLFYVCERLAWMCL